MEIWVNENLVKEKENHFLTFWKQAEKIFNFSGMWYSVPIWIYVTNPSYFVVSDYIRLYRRTSISFLNIFFITLFMLIVFYLVKNYVRYKTCFLFSPFTIIIISKFFQTLNMWTSRFRYLLRYDKNLDY